jgi:predicted SPOUT superfamily RNA methylase MTH1
MGGESAYGGAEVVAIMPRNKNIEPRARYEYKLLATNKTSTMQKELQEAGDLGFEYRDQTVFNTAYGGANEVVVILERDKESPIRKWEYKLLATSKTSTMQKELQESGSGGFQFVGVTVGKTAYGGKEVVSILRRLVQQGAN